MNTKLEIKGNNLYDEQIVLGEAKIHQIVNESAPHEVHKLKAVKY